MWTVVQTHPQAERRAAQHLTHSGYQTYLPLISVQRRDRVIRTLLHRVEVPLFASYLFVTLGEHEPWSPILYTAGVNQVLMSGDRPHRLSEAVMIALRASEQFRRTQPPASVIWAPGTPCRPSAGTPFAGHDAVILTTRGSRATIAMMLFGELREVTVDISSLRLRDE